MTRRPSLILTALLAAVLSLTACGKKGPPETMPGGQYPTTYPSR